MQRWYLLTFFSFKPGKECTSGKKDEIEAELLILSRNLSFHKANRLSRLYLWRSIHKLFQPASPRTGCSEAWISRPKQVRLSSQPKRLFTQNRAGKQEALFISEGAL